MSLFKLLQAKDAVQEMYENEEVIRVSKMIYHNRHNTDVSDADYGEGIAMLISIASAVTTHNLMIKHLGEEEYKKAVAELDEFRELGDSITAEEQN
jgi:hypothetical protein